MIKWQKIGKGAILAILVSGCTHMPQGSEEQVAAIVQEKIAKDVVWKQSGYANASIASYVQDFIRQPMTIESAIQIALLNNPEIQATLEEIGIAQADLVEAGLLSNPAFEVEVRYPYCKRLRTNIEYLITTAILDIFLIPLKTRLAATELEQTKLRVSHEILGLAFEVRKTYYELLGEQQMLKYTHAIAELNDIQTEISARQSSVGNVYKLDRDQFLAQSLKSRLQIDIAQQELIRLREKFSRLLGLHAEVRFTLPDQLSEEIDYSGLDLCLLESIALQERLDLQIARCEVIRLCRLLGLRDGWTYTNLHAGLAGERDPDGQNLVGFGLSGEVPIFNNGQTARMRLFAQLRQAQDSLAALEIRVLSEVKEGHKLVMNALRVIDKYRLEILPLQKATINASEELYNVMGLGVDRLLVNKLQEIEMHRSYTESLKEYWNARVHLDQALGGYLFRLLQNYDEGFVE